MKPVPIDLVLHTLAAHLSDPEGTAEAIALGQAIYSHAVDHRALPGQWCADYADPEPQAGWLVRRLNGQRARPAADLRVLEVEVARRLADAGLAMLVTQDAEDLAAATLLLDASRRVVGLERGQAASDDHAEVIRLANEADMLRRERDTALRERVTARDEHEAVVRSLEARADTYARDRDAHARDVVRARDEADKLKAIAASAEENAKATCQQRDNLDVELKRAREESAAMRVSWHAEHLTLARANADLHAIRSAYLDAAGATGTVRDIVGAVQRGATWTDVEENRKINEHVAFEAELTRRAKDHDFNAKVAAMSARLTNNAEVAAKADAVNLRSIVRQRDDHIIEQANAHVDLFTEELAAAKDETSAQRAFKVGDRVRYARAKDGGVYAAPPIGWEGTIEAVDGRTGAYLFRFVGKRWPTCEGEPYWYCSAEELDHVAATAPPTFKVGDRVIYVEYSSQIVWTVEQVQADGLSCHLHRSFRPAMVSACTAICNVPVASLTRAP